MKFTELNEEEIYLDWVNNFLTVECFAEYYELEVNYASEWLYQYARKRRRKYAIN